MKRIADLVSELGLYKRGPVNLKSVCMYELEFSNINSLYTSDHNCYHFTVPVGQFTSSESNLLTRTQENNASEQNKVRISRVHIIGYIGAGCPNSDWPHAA
jgi:hypothetical protein